MVQYVNISLCAGNFYKNDFIEPELLLSAIVKKGGQNIVELGFSLKTGIKLKRIQKFVSGILIQHQLLLKKVE